jgi:hypothetical protein
MIDVGDDGDVSERFDLSYLSNSLATTSRSVQVFFHKFLKRAFRACAVV